MGDVIRWRRRGTARSREDVLDSTGFSTEERAAITLCGATFTYSAGTSLHVLACRLPSDHDGEHVGDKQGRWRWSDSDETITRL